MPSYCPQCSLKGTAGTVFVRFGFFFRTSDHRHIQRFRCQACRGTCSVATFHAWFRQKKRLKNHAIRVHLAGAGSLRRAARTVHLNRKTVERKLIALGIVAEKKLQEQNRKKPLCTVIEFDDMETFVHTKLKPLSITLAVESHTRRILGIQVSPMPAKGLLAKHARKKYGYRADGRAKARDRLFLQIKDLVSETATIKSDLNPHYAPSVKKHFPKATHIGFKGQRGRSQGLGELKKVGFDPLFSLNHTCAMFRANVNRLFRKTWCTTKRADRLYAHLMIYAEYHNEHLKPKALPKT